MLFGAVLCGVGLMLPYLWPKVATLYVSATVIGAGFVIYNVAVQNLTGAWGPREDRAENFSTLSLGYSISSFIGPLAVGYVIEYSDHAHAYLYLSLSTLLAVAILLSYRKLREVRTPPAAEHTQSAFSLLLQPELRKVLLTGAMIVTGWDLYMFYLPLYGHSIGLAPSTIGIILGMFAVATFVVRFLAAATQCALYGTARARGVDVFRRARFYRVSVRGQCMADRCAVVRDRLGTRLRPADHAIDGLQPLPPGRTGEVTGVRMTLNHFTHTVVPVVAGGLGAAFGMTPVFVMIASVLGVSGYLSATVRRAEPPPPA